MIIFIIQQERPSAAAKQTLLQQSQVLADASRVAAESADQEEDATVDRYTATTNTKTCCGTMFLSARRVALLLAVGFLGLGIIVARSDPLSLLLSPAGPIIERAMLAAGYPTLKALRGLDPVADPKTFAAAATAVTAVRPNLHPRRTCLCIHSVSRA
jgi:hypothetical protein